MTGLLRQLALIAVAAALTWWALLRPPADAAEPARAPRPQPLSVALMPVSEPLVAADPLERAPAAEPPAARPAPAPEQERVPESVPEDSVAEDSVTEESVTEESVAAESVAEQDEPDPPAPPPPELGAHGAEGELASARSDAGEGRDDPPADAEAGATPARRAVGELMRDAELLAEARSELAGEARGGFATVLLAAPEDQLDIARFFGEPLVLVPRDNLDPEAGSPTYFRLEPDGGGVRAVAGRAPLEGFRQYRDLFDYEYARLDAPLRELRRSVLARSEIYLFAALVPLEEWAVIVGRRRAALALSGRERADVRRYVLRYVRTSSGGFDLEVDEIVFADGERFQPPPAHRKDS